MPMKWFETFLLFLLHKPNLFDGIVDNQIIKAKSWGFLFFVAEKLLVMVYWRISNHYMFGIIIELKKYFLLFFFRWEKLDKHIVISLWKDLVEFFAFFPIINIFYQRIIGQCIFNQVWKMHVSILCVSNF